MDSLAYIIPFILLSGVGVLVLFIVAVVQEGKSEHKGGFRQAFYTMVALVMLAIAVGSTIALLNIGFRQFVFKSAKNYQQRYNNPPSLYLPSQGTGVIPLKEGGATVAPVPGSTTPTAYTCTTDCQFTADDKTAVEQWTSSYKTWIHDRNFSLETRRSVANALGFMIVSLPLFIIFFRLMERGNRQETTGRPSPLRSLYFYFVAFIGLIMAVIAAGVVINDGLKIWLKTTPDNSTSIAQPTPAAADLYAVKSLVSCHDKCGFTHEQVSLAQQWETDSAEVIKNQQSNSGQFSNDLAMAIPFLIVGLPLFLFHFMTVRKETSTKTPPATL